MSGFARALRETLAAVFSDRAVLSTMVIAVVVYSFYYPSAYHHEVAQHVPVVAVDLDHSASSRAVLRRLDALRAVDVNHHPASLAEARRMLERGDAHGILLLPAGFERDRLRGDGAWAAIYSDGADLARSSLVQGALSDAVFGAGAPRLRLVPRPLFNTREGYGSSIVPAVAILIIHQTLLLGIGLLLATRREERGRVALASAELAGMFAAACLVGFVNLLYFTGFVFWFQDYPRGGNFTGLLAAAVLFVAAVSALALFVGSFFRVREHALLFLLMTSLPLFFAANLSWPVEATPRALAWLAKLVPSTPGINAMVKLNEMGASLHEAAPELANLAALALAYAALAWWRTRPDQPTIV